MKIKKKNMQVDGKGREYELTEEGYRVYARNEKGQPICGVPKGGGERLCRNKNIYNNGRCEMHNGRNYPKGMDIVPLKEQGIAKYMHLPTGMVGSLLNHMRDADYLSSKPDIAFTDTVIEEESKELLSIEQAGFKTIEKLIETIRSLFKESTEEATDEIDTTAYAIMMAVDQFKSRHAVIERIKSHQEHRRKLVDTETRRLSAAMKQLTAEQAFAFVNGIIAIVTNHITDPEVFDAIATDIEKLMQVPLEIPGIRDKFINRGRMRTETPVRQEEEEDEDILEYNEEEITHVEGEIV